MKRSISVLMCAIVLAALAPTTSFADVELIAERDGAFMRIVVPDNWNGELVIWAHGFSLSPLAEIPDLGPLAPLQLSEGYAVAASSYSQIGWALFRTLRDHRNLIQFFRHNFGEPRQILINGASLGGIVTAQALERLPDVQIAGAYPVCGAVAGSRAWDGGLDLRLIYDFVCGDVPGAAIPGGASGLPLGSGLDQVGLALAVNACTGILAPPAFRTPDQADRLARILAATTIPENFLLTDMGFSTFGLSDLTHDPGKLSGKIGVGNEHVAYPDPEINTGIARVSPNRGARARLRHNFTPRGDVRGTKIVSMHTDKDGLVIVEHETEYAQVVPSDQLTTAIVVEDVPSHCGFTEAEVVAGWELMRAWVAGFPQPTAADLQGTCQLLELAGLAAGPCRIDPAFALQDMDTRILPGR